MHERIRRLMRLTTHNHRIAADRFFPSSLICLLVICFFFFAGLPGVSTIWAAPSASSSQTNNQENSPVSLKLISSTSLLKAGGGYQLTATVTNTSSVDIGEGRLSVYTNSRYSFPNSDSLQQWAQGASRIPTPQLLGSVIVPALKAGESTTVSVSADPSSPILQYMRAWGAKPVDIRYTAQKTDHTDFICQDLYTFLTRTNTDTPAKNLPKIKMVFALPELAGADTGANRESKKANKDFIHNLLQGNSPLAVKNLSRSSVNKSVSTDKLNRLLYAASVTKKFSFVQALIDPSLSEASSSKKSPRVNLQTAGLLQPYGLNVSLLSETGLSQWKKSGLKEQSWNAHQARQLADNSRNPLLSPAASLPLIAWQGSHSTWSSAGLARVKGQGYEAVAADRGFTDSRDSAVHTGKLTVPTTNGNITVLTAQEQLSKLASGSATSSTALAETSSAGRINRFIAQSAFYETEAPYEERILLVALKDKQTQASHAATAALLTRVLRCPWIEQTNLQTLLKANSHYSLQEAAAMAQANRMGKADQAALRSYQEAAAELASARKRLTFFTSTVLVPSTKGGNSTASNAQGLSQGKAQSNSLATSHGYTLENSSVWSSALETVFDSYAQRTLSSGGIDKGYSSAAQYLVSSLYQTIQLAPPGSVNTVSNKASLPLTINNSLPFAVKIGIRGQVQQALAVNTGISIEPLKSLIIHAHDDQQATLVISAEGGRTAKATIYLTNAEGAPLGNKVTTTITGTISVNDVTGYALIGLALVLAVLGLYRQVRRMIRSANRSGKDPQQSENH